MPFSLPAVGALLTDANFTNPLKSFIDGLESTSATSGSSAGISAARI